MIDDPHVHGKQNKNSYHIHEKPLATISTSSTALHCKKILGHISVMKRVQAKQLEN